MRSAVKWFPCAVVALLVLTAEVRSADAPDYLVVDGDVSSALNFAESDFRKLPRTKIEVKDAAGILHTYEGVALSHILTMAGVPLRADLKGADIAKFLHAQGRDGFAAVFSLPEFDNQDFVVADSHNGKPLEEASGPLQIISPNETRRSRWIKQLNILRIKRSQ